MSETEATAPESLREWRCFHCDAVFATVECAAEHFGKWEECDPICKVGAERYRDLENQLAAYRSEADDTSKSFYGMGAAHTQALMREEQKGYDKGLADGRAHPTPVHHAPIGDWLDDVEKCSLDHKTMFRRPSGKRDGLALIRADDLRRLIAIARAAGGEQ